MAKPKQIFYRLIIDTLVFAPVTYTGFYLFKDVLFRKDKTKINYEAEIKEKFIPTLVADWIIWAPVNLVNFWWVPIQWQGLYVGVFSFFFNVILSYISNL
jgi:protein Mpv17